MIEQVERAQLGFQTRLGDRPHRAESVETEREQVNFPPPSGNLPRPDDETAMLCRRIHPVWQQRQDLLRAEKRLQNQCRAFLIRYVWAHHPDHEGHEPSKEIKVRAGQLLRLHQRKTPPKLDAEDNRDYLVTYQMLQPFLAALAPIQAALAEREKELERLAGQLPIAEWVKATPGLSLMSLAALVGFAGDLSRFPTPGKLEVMMSIGFVAGERQRRIAKDSKLAIELRFSPQRRAFLYTLAKGAMMNRTEPWRTIYDERKALEEATRPEITKGQRDNSALRIVARRMLLAVWREWRRVRGMYHWAE